MLNLAATDLKSFVSRFKADYFRTMKVLPYNRFDAARSQLWWLLPADDKVAFRWGKAALWQDDETGEVRCGFHVEKGVLADADPKSTKIMQPDWFWHRFLDLVETDLPDVVAHAAMALGQNLELDIGCGILSPDADWTRLEFTIDGPTLTQMKYEPADGILNDLAESENFTDFSRTLQSLDGAPTVWHWIGVTIGARCKHRSESAAPFAGRNVQRS